MRSPAPSTLAAVRRPDDDILLAHLGAVDVALAAAHASLAAAAAAFDADPKDRSGRAAVIARRTSGVVEATVTEVIDRVGRALGAAPLAMDRDHARRVADLQLYVRQSHADRDLADLGRRIRRHRRAVVTTTIEGAGTTEAVWWPWLAERAWPQLDLAELLGARRVVVLAAHPDDEVLGVGGLLRRLTACGAPIVVVWATDGEASHPGSTALSPRRLATLRRAESLAGLEKLAVVPSEIHHLGLARWWSSRPPGGADRHTRQA